MGLFKRIFGPKKTIEDLIRSLVRKRVLGDGTVTDPAEFNVWLDNATQVILYGVPEASIVTIIQTYVDMEAKGYNHYDILNTIEESRSRLVEASPEMKAMNWDSATALKLLKDMDT
jgi:hypothetical protein